MILHVCTSAEWEACSQNEFYAPFAFEEEGFIHCCTERQLPAVLERYFINKKDLLLLRINETRLKEEVRFETGPNGDEFPHIYAQVNKDAIISVDKL